MTDISISIPNTQSMSKDNNNSHEETATSSYIQDIPLYVLMFMLFMASSYFTNFFPQHTAKLIVNEPIARHVLGYTILITSVASVRSTTRVIYIMLASFVAYLWCYLISRQGPIAFSISLMALMAAYLLNRDIEHYSNFIKRICSIARCLCISLNICIIIVGLYVEY